MDLEVGEGDCGFGDDLDHNHSEDPYCYDTANHTVVPIYNQMDCEASDSYVWVDDHGDDDEEEMFPCDGGNTWIPWDWVNDGYEDCEDGSDEYDDDGDDDYAFYCSNDGEDYAETMGGILCPEGPGVTPE